MRFLSIFLLVLGFSFGALAQEDQVAIVPQMALRDAVHEMMASAQKEILLAHFILLNDESGVGVIQHLIRKAKEGVKVRVILDGVGAYSDERISQKNLREIASHGVEIKVFHPRLKHFYKIWKRMHDKILLVDDRALLGSSSFWDVSFDRWQVETDIMIKGDVVHKVRGHFEELWNSKEVSVIKPKMSSRTVYFDTKVPFQNVLHNLQFRQTKGLVYWYDGAKKSKRKGSYEEILGLIHQAQEEVVIVNSYFLPDTRLQKAIVEARQRGVQISLFTNSAEVLALEYKMLGMAYSKYDRLFKKWGITVYEAPETFGMIHSKFILMDRKKIYIGGQNLDSLGAKHNTENGICFESQEFVHWFQSEIAFYKANFDLAFQENIAFRKPYHVKNKGKRYWRKFLASMLKSIL